MHVALHTDCVRLTVIGLRDIRWNYPTVVVHLFGVSVGSVYFAWSFNKWLCSTPCSCTHTHTHTLAVHRCHRCVHCARHSDPPVCYHFCIARSVSPCRRLEPTLYSFSFCAAAPAVSKEDGCRPGAQHVTTVVRKSSWRRTPWDHLYCVPMMYRSLLLRLGAFLDVLAPLHRYVTRLNFSLLIKRINVTTVGRRRHRHAMRTTSFLTDHFLLIRSICNQSVVRFVLTIILKRSDLFPRYSTAWFVEPQLWVKFVARAQKFKVTGGAVAKVVWLSYDKTFPVIRFWTGCGYRYLKLATNCLWKSLLLSLLTVV